MPLSTTVHQASRAPGDLSKKPARMTPDEKRLARELHFDRHEKPAAIAKVLGRHLSCICRLLGQKKAPGCPEDGPGFTHGAMVRPGLMGGVHLEYTGAHRGVLLGGPKREPECPRGMSWLHATAVVCNSLAGAVVCNSLRGITRRGMS